MRAVGWALVLFVAVGCVPTAKTPEPVGEGTCAGMCGAFRLFGCRAGAPSPRLGITCEERCEGQLVTRAVVPPMACVAAASSVEDVERCGERCLR